MRYPKQVVTGQQQVVTGQQVDEGHAKRARQLRRAMTDAEMVLWQCLRANRLVGLHFRRQQVIRGFIVDFYCHAAGLVIEVDGEVHTHLEEYDRERDQILASHGVRILRVSNAAVMQSLEQVLAKIQATCREELNA